MSDAGRVDAPRLRELATLADLAALRRLARLASEHHLPAFAAGLAYGAVFALLPIMLLLVLLLGVFGAVGLVERSIEEIDGALPSDVIDLLRDQLLIVARTDHDLGSGVLVSAIVAIWGASGAMRRVMEALNVVHGVEEGRSFVRRIATSVVLALGAIFLFAVAAAVIALGGGVTEHVFEALGIGRDAAPIWDALRWPVLVIMTWLVIAGAYRFAPARRHVGGLLTPGTVLATAAFVVFTIIFSWYVGSVGGLGAAWGSLAGIVLFLLYIQYAGLVVLAGAQLDAFLVAERSGTAR